MKKRSLAGNVAIGFFVVAVITVCVAFSTPSWLVSDPRITGAKLNKLGLWVHCFRSLGDPYDTYLKRFFVGCRWIYDPFTTGYDQIRGFLVPPFMVATQLFYTVCFICVLVSAILCLVYFLCFTPAQKRFLQLVKCISFLTLVGGLCGGIAVIVFVSLGNRNNWMPGHDNNFFGWSFVLACIGAITTLVASVLFFTESYIYQKKRRYLKESQTRFEIEQESKA